MPDRSTTLYSVFQPSHIRATIDAAYDIGVIRHVELFSRSWTDVHKVYTDGGLFAARIWRAGFHHSDQVRFECDYLRALDRAGFPVQPPLAARDGRLVLHLAAPEGERPLALFRWIDGEKVGASADPEMCRAIGRLLARLHAAGDQCRMTPPHQESFPARIRRMLPLVAAMLAPRRIPADIICDGMARVADQLERLPPDLPIGILHGDFHPYNVLRTDDAGGLAVIDFDDVCAGPLVRDVAAFLWVVEHLNDPIEVYRHFLEGYESLRPLSPAEHAAIPLFVAARDCWTILGWTSSIDQLGDPADAFGKCLAAAAVRFAAL